MPNKVGRPTKANKKAEMVATCVTKGQLLMVQERAATLGMSVSKYLFTLLEKDMPMVEEIQ